MKGKDLISRRNFLKGSLAAATGISLIKSIAGAGEIIGPGRLDIQNYIDPANTSGLHKSMHYAGTTEGFDDSWDRFYDPLLGPGINSKIISTIPGYELQADVRPLESKTPINLELSLHTQSGASVTVSNMENELRCAIDPTSKGWDFGIKPITLWRRDMANPDLIYFLADIREAISKSDFAPEGIKTARVPLPNLNGTYNSEEPYMLAQIRFDTFPGDFNLDGKVNLKDYPYLAGDWGQSGDGLIGDIAGPNGVPDGKVDGIDLGAYSVEYLKDSNDPNTW